MNNSFVVVPFNIVFIMKQRPFNVNNNRELSHYLDPPLMYCQNGRNMDIDTKISYNICARWYIQELCFIDIYKITFAQYYILKSLFVNVQFLCI